jgi:hypothetical protein
MDDRIGQFGRVVALHLAGESWVDIAKRLGVARSTIYMWRDDPAYRLLEDEMHRQATDAAMADVRAAIGGAVGMVIKVSKGDFYDPAHARTSLAGALKVLELARLLAPSAPADALSDAELDALAFRAGWIRVPTPTEEPLPEPSEELGTDGKH